jgi:hypothetical protein
MEPDQPFDHRLTKALKEAMKMRAQLVADGTPDAEANRIVGHGLYMEFGHGRQTLYRCPKCHDTGFTFRTEDTSRTYGSGSVSQRAYPCDELCAFRVHERSMRQQAFGGTDASALSAAGRTRRTAR